MPFPTYQHASFSNENYSKNNLNAIFMFIKTLLHRCNYLKKKKGRKKEKS